MTKQDELLGQFILLHRSVAICQDAVVKRHKAKLIKFIEQLKESILFEHQKIRYRNEVLWSVDDEYVPEKDKAAHKGAK